MYHKIRGGKGEWREVAPWELIRVTKGVGKKVKMVVEAPGRFGPSDIHLALTDMTDAVRTPRTPGNRSSKSSRFIIESTTVGVLDVETGKSSAELIIKLFKLSKQLVFQASVSVHGNGSDATTVLRGQSAPFGTHNSGKQRRKRDKEGEEDDEEEFANAAPGAAAPSATNLLPAQQQASSLYPRRKKQPKREEREEAGWHALAPGAPSGQPNSHLTQHHSSHHATRGATAAAAAAAAVNLGEDFLESIWPPEDAPVSAQKDIVQNVNNVMRQFGHKHLLEEARKRRAGVVVYVACRRSAQHQPSDDFTTFVYKQENLLKEDAVTIGTPLGRALFIPIDETTGDSVGVYTLVAAVRLGLHDFTFAPNSGIAAVYDFRRVNSTGPESINDFSMKTIPIHAVLLSHEPTTVWLIGSFNVDSRNVGWMPMPPPAYAPSPMAAANPLARVGGGVVGGAFGGYGGHHGLGLGHGNGHLGSHGGPGQVVPPLPLGASPLAAAYPHLAMQYSPRGSLHSPVPYYGAPGGATTPGGYLSAPKALYPPGTPTSSAAAAAAAAAGIQNGSITPSGLLTPSTTPGPGVASNVGSNHNPGVSGASPSPASLLGGVASAGGNGGNSVGIGGIGGGGSNHNVPGVSVPGAGSLPGGLLGPPTPGLGQTPRGFGDLLSPFSSNPAAMSGFYSPLSGASYQQSLYGLWDPGILLSARGLASDPSLAAAAAGFYSPTSAGSAANSASTNSSTATANGGVNTGARGGQGQLGQYPYPNFFSGTSPRFEELLDSARM